MFIKNSVVNIVDDNYVDVIDYPIQFVNRKHSISSYNYAQKIMFFSHINSVVSEVKTAEFKLVKLIAVNTLGQVFEVVCDDCTEIGTVNRNYITYTKINQLRANSSILVDTTGMPCKIISIEDYTDLEEMVYDVMSNKGRNKFVNGLMFKA